MASRPHLDSCAGKRTCEIQPTEIYYGNTKDLKPQIKLRIATGGAGQSGLIKALADAFIDTQVSNQCPPFAVSWIKSDTTASFNHLADGSADLSITYNAAAEKIAMAQGNADKHVYAWRDHFLFVGPKDNPANLITSQNTTIEELFSQLFIAAIASDNAVRFLSRYDKSATNIKESAIWTSIGQTPWSYPFSFFYHINPEFPYQALATAARLHEYTLTDRGTWYGVESWIRDEMEIFMEGKDEDEMEILLNPAHALVGAYGENKAMADTFAEWMARSDGGQKVVGEFAVNGVVLYTKVLEDCGS
ncbi:MAG: hypothetical protein ASARMPRED_003168 [Alectoria sarmentosa]|nr:MAG: hypothetical protein ASARMPRED_003168 [Alectoria sarmentosa]